MKIQTPVSVLMAWMWTILITVCVLAASRISPYDPGEINLTNVLDPPSLNHWLGTDHLGRDVLSRLIHGSRISISVGLGAVSISTLFGILIGAIAGYFGKAIDRILMSFTDLMLCFPSFFLILTIIAVIDQPGIWPIILILGITGWMGVARLVRAEVLTLREREYIDAARTFGAGDGHILFRHLIPNAMAPVWVAMTLGIATAILTESGLSFLGIGVQPPVASWGNMLTDGKDALGVAWWLLWSPGIVILFTVISFHILADQLRDKFNVRKQNTSV